MAMTSAERSAAARQRREQRGETILRLPTLAGTRQQLADLMKWHDIEEMAEAVTLLILNAHTAGPEGSAPMLAVPRHEISMSETWRKRIQKAGAREAASMDMD